MKKIKIHWPSAFLSILLALTVWFTVEGGEKVETWVNVRLEIKDVPANYVLINTNTIPATVEVRLSGPSGLVRDLTGQNIPMLLSLAEIDQGKNIIPLTDEAIQLSAAFDIMEIRPSSIEVDADMEIKKEVSLRASSAHPLPDNIVKIEFIAPQKTITLKGPQTVLERIRRVEALVSLPAVITQNKLQLTSYINLPQGVKAIPPNPKIEVLIQAKPKTITLQRSVGISNLDVLPPNLSIRPAAVTVTLLIPFNWNEENKELQKVFASVKLPSKKIQSPPSELPISIHAPDNVKIISINPEKTLVGIEQ